MEGQQSLERKARLAGFFVVLALHAALFYSLWHYRTVTSPARTTTVFVDLLKDLPRAEPPKTRGHKPKSQPVKLEEPNTPPPLGQRVAQAPMVLPTKSVAPPPPPPESQPAIEVPAEPAPLTPPPAAKPAGPVVLTADLAIACPIRTPPSYPPLSRRLGEEGKAVLRVELDDAGQVDLATIKTSSGYSRLDEAALSAVRQWRCNPARRGGVAVRAVAIQPINFVLEGQ
ncbi:MAG: energy transducer TonB [Thiobacillaceae bacterium]